MQSIEDVDFVRTTVTPFIRLRVRSGDIEIRIRAEPSPDGATVAYLNNGHEIEVLDLRPGHPLFNPDFFVLANFNGKVCLLTLLCVLWY